MNKCAFENSLDHDDALRNQRHSRLRHYSSHLNHPRGGSKNQRDFRLLRITARYAQFVLCSTEHNKKNWPFIGDATAAGERGAILYTIVGNCRPLGVDSCGYLCAPLNQAQTNGAVAPLLFPDY